MKTEIKFDFEMVMGIVHASRELRHGGLRFSRAILIEKAIEKTSNLKYVGLDTTLGRDFECPITKTRYECKGQDNLFQTNRTIWTDEFTLKNFMGNKSGPKKTYDYMILIDQTRNAIAYTDYENSIKRWRTTTDGIKLKVDKTNMTYLAKDIKPASVDKVRSLYNSIVDEIFKL
jgi:hypothetical protein